jgi:outer membrane protein assembly factor BamB
VEPPARVPVRLVITARDTAVATGGRLSYSAVAVDSAGVAVPTDPVTWGVTWTVIGTIGPDGVFTARSVGSTFVRARLADPPLADSVRVWVVAPGTVKWVWAAAEAGGLMPDFGGPALGTDGTIYVRVDSTAWPDNAGTVVALARDGAVRWRLPLLQVAAGYGVVVTTEPERLWLAARGLYLISPEGAVLWDSAVATSNPLFKGGAASASLLVAAQGEHVAAYRADTQGLLWQSPFAPLTSWLVPPTITAEGHVLAKRTADTLFLFRGTDGTVLRWFLDPDSLVDKRVFGVGTVPVGNRYYLPTASRLAAFDTAGTLLWLTPASGLGMTEPVVGPDGTIYVQNRVHGLGALSPDGTLRWKQFSVQPRWPWLGGAALAEGGIVYAAGINAFWAVSTEGTVLWSYRADSTGAPQAFTGSPAIAPDGTVYTFTRTHVYAFWAPGPPEPDSPWPMWRHDAQRTGWAGYRAR